jgi:hypothetical protein
VSLFFLLQSIFFVHLRERTGQRFCTSSVNRDAYSVYITSNEKVLLDVS